MRANTGGHAVVLPCPQCARRWSTEQTLAGHLMDEHGMAPSPAVARAMQVAHECVKNKTGPKPKEPTHEPQEAPAAAEERAMSDGKTWTCSRCGGMGHTARSPQCPKYSKPAPKASASPKCGYCHHLKTDHRAKCPFGIGGKKGKPVTRKSPKAAASRNGFAGALTALRAERAELDQAIAALERLEARGRL